MSRDGTTELMAVHLGKSFVSPATQQAVAWLQAQPAADGLAPPAGLDVALDGRRGARAATTWPTSRPRSTAPRWPRSCLLLVVLLVVYRSFWLALVPLATIGVSLVIARGVLAWMTLAGWEISPLVELFLVAVLFGSGTDFCLFISWRFAEHWDPDDPAGAMRADAPAGHRRAADQRRDGDRRPAR